ncbi:MAG: 2-C-methyl-D-erythritol 4-phosphate cytidylyltransferase [Chloroflexia bacterium]|nr:2-C-methyl-D-erythritol 4-phosphate cytidylyltransferase [Chloroflexia bacterium]
MTTAHDAALGVVIVAAGSGQRFGDAAKVFSRLDGQPVLHHSLQLFLSMPEVQHIVVVLGAHTIEEGTTLIQNRFSQNVQVCLGGETRSDSVRAGLTALPKELELVAVHDAGRPLVQRNMTRRVVAAARECGAAVPVVPVSDTLVRIDVNGQVVSIEERDGLGAVQTPQVARRDWLASALRAETSNTDEGGALLLAGYPVMTVEGAVDNIKLTWPGDLTLAEAILRRRNQ